MILIEYFKECKQFLMLYPVSKNIVPVLVQLIANILHSLKYFEELQICASTLRFSDLLLYIGFWMNQVIAKIYYIEIKNAPFSNSQSYFKIKKYFSTFSLW